MKLEPHPNILGRFQHPYFRLFYVQNILFNETGKLGSGFRTRLSVQQMDPN
jgi:hypothetical protein